MFHGASISRIEGFVLARSFGTPTLGTSTGRVMRGTCSPTSQRLPTYPTIVQSQAGRIRTSSLHGRLSLYCPRSYSTSVTALMSKQSKGGSERATLEEQVVDLIDAEIQESSEIVEVLHAFLSQTGFELNCEGDHVGLRKETGEKTVLVSFALYEEGSDVGGQDDDISNEPQPLGMDARWDTKGQGLEISCFVTLSSPGESGITLECAVGPAKGGEFYVESISSGSGTQDMMFAALSDGLQAKIYEYLSSFDVNDNLAKFILHYVNHQDTNATYHALSGFKSFLSCSK